MNDLTKALEELVDPEKRIKKALIEILLPSIAVAQKEGYKLKAIHSEIEKFFQISFLTFKVTLHRVKKVAKANPPKVVAAKVVAAKVDLPEKEKTSPIESPQLQPLSVRVADAKNKLSQYK